MARRMHRSGTPGATACRTSARRVPAHGGGGVREGGTARKNLAPETLPTLSSLTELPAFDELIATDRQLSAFSRERERLECAEGVPVGEVELGCVVRLDRGFPAVVTAGGLYRAEFAAALSKGGANSRAAVGDWVCARRPAGHDMGIICAILPRESDISRWRGKSRGERQTLAANVDIVLVTQALGAREVSCERAVRSAVVARDCGADIAVVLTKADRTGDDLLAHDISLIRDVIGPGVRIVVTCAGTRGGHDPSGLEATARNCAVGWGSDDLLALVPTGVVGIVLGESGAGKSTLLNALLGRESLETGSVRASDDAGRHTTVARRMVSLPGAGVIVDEPGLRSLPLVGHERGLALVFPELASAAGDCRFRDCTHTHEPGCAVRRLIGDGLVPSARADAYLSLAAEMRLSARSLDPDVTL